MRMLLDENIDRSLKGLFAAEFEVMTVRESGWQGKTNGELLRAAEQEFEVLVDHGPEPGASAGLAKTEVGCTRASSKEQRLFNRRAVDARGERCATLDPVWRSNTCAGLICSSGVKRTLTSPS